MDTHSAMKAELQRLRAARAAGEAPPAAPAPAVATQHNWKPGDSGKADPMSPPPLPASDKLHDDTKLTSPATAAKPDTIGALLVPRVLSVQVCHPDSSDGSDKPSRETVKLTVYQDISQTMARGLGVTVWDAALLMVRHLQDPCCFPPGHWEGKQVLELGCGTGYVGLALAALGAHVTLTDLPSILPITQYNVDANRKSLPSEVPRVQRLCWGTDPVPQPAGGSKAWDVVVASDVVYDQRFFKPLLSTIVEAMKSGGGGAAAAAGAGAGGGAGAGAGAAPAASSGTVLYLGYERRRVEEDVFFEAMGESSMSATFVDVDDACDCAVIVGETVTVQPEDLAMYRILLNPTTAAATAQTTAATTTTTATVFTVSMTLHELGSDASATSLTLPLQVPLQFVDFEALPGTAWATLAALGVDAVEDGDVEGLASRGGQGKAVSTVQGSSAEWAPVSKLGKVADKHVLVSVYDEGEDESVVLATVLGGLVAWLQGAHVTVDAGRKAEAVALMQLCVKANAGLCKGKGGHVPPAPRVVCRGGGGGGDDGVDVLEGDECWDVVLLPGYGAMAVDVVAEDVWGSKC